MYAAELAADGAVAGAARLSAGARPGEEILTWQTAEITARLPTLTKGIIRLLHIDVIRGQHKRVAKIKASRGDVIRIQGIRFNALVPRLPGLRPGPAGAGPDRGPGALAITGGQDVQVPPGPRGYRRAVRQPVSPEVLDLITAWVGQG